jgi:vancomycin resistance protein YoaR
VSAPFAAHAKLLLGAVAASVVVCLLGAALIFQGLYRGRIYPGVQVAVPGGAIDVGGQTREEALRALGAHAERFLASPITLRHLGKEWRTTPRELGARVELGATVEAALAIGRGGALLDRLRAEAATLRDGASLPAPPVSIDEQRLTGYVARLSPEVERAPSSADLALMPDGGVTVLASQSGRRLNVGRNVDQLKTALLAYSTASLQLTTEDVLPPLLEGDLAEVKGRAEKIVGAPVTLQVALPEGARSWTLERQDLIDLLELKTTSTRPPNYELRIDDERIRRYVERIAPEVERGARNARFVVEDGVARVIRESQEGRRLEVTVSINLIRAALTADDRRVTLPWQPVRPLFASDDAPRLQFPERIERATTAYGGTLPERMFNVELAAQRINGVVVGPGDSFSFNDEVGEVSYRSGYKKGYGISQDGDEVVTIPSEGGGICQVATTLFQAVFWGGYPIVERNWHLYWIPRYGQRPRGLKGLDATIDQVYDPDGKLLYAVDLRWRNNTEAPVLVAAETDGKQLSVSLLGRKPLWQVKVGDPKIEKVVKADTRPVRQPDATLANGAELMIERAEDGFQSTIVRSTWLDGKLLDETRLVSTYRPSRNVYLVGGASARAGARIEDRPATPASVPTSRPSSLVTPLPAPDTPTPAPRATSTPLPAPSRTPTPRPSATTTR